MKYFRMGDYVRLYKDCRHDGMIGRVIKSEEYIDSWKRLRLRYTVLIRERRSTAIFECDDLELVQISPLVYWWDRFKNWMLS